MPPITQDEVFTGLFETLKRRLPALFLQRWDGLTGEGLMAALTRVFAELMRRVDTQTAGVLVRDATGPKKAAGTISITFDEACVDTYGIDAGTVIAKTPWGVEFVLTEQLLREALDPAATLTLAVEARWAGDWGNVPDNMITAWGFNILDENTLTWDPGTLSAGKAEFLQGVVSDAIRIAGNTRMEGGRIGTLDLIGKGRGIPRASDETDVLYRPRIRTPPLNAITTNGILRAVNKALGYDGAEIIEFWEDGFTWGQSGWGNHPWSSKRHAVLLIPNGADVASYQALVNSIRLPTIFIRVLERS